MSLADRVEELEQQLAACQADNLRLRDALDSALGCIDGYYRDSLADEFALADTPPGDLSALRDVCADILEESALRVPGQLNDAEALRLGKWTPEALK